MSKYIEPRLMYSLQNSFALATKISFDMSNNPEKCWAELKRRRAVIKAYARRCDETEFMPCGYQDAAGDALDRACTDFSNYLNAMHISRGKLPIRLTQRLSWAIQD